MGIFDFLKRQKNLVNISSGFDQSRILENFLNSQLDTLSRNKIPVCLNEITASYFLNLLAVLTQRAVSFDEARLAAKRIFKDFESSALIDNGFRVLSSDAQKQEKLAALFPIAKQEAASGQGDFLVRHSKKAQKNMAKMFEDSNWDPVSAPLWSPKDLA
jgi:hypothetical protein